MFRKAVATVVFVRDLASQIIFYRDTLGLEMQGSDPDSASFKFENILFHLLAAPAAADLLRKEAPALKLDGAPRWLLAVEVEQVDAAYETLKSRGVTFLIPPTDQFWGLRSAHFADPEGNLWEIHQPIAS
jgi:lactoylglutathione lyase